MPLQDIDFFGNLPTNPLDPAGTDSRTISDDQHRNIIASLSRQAPNWTGAITASHVDINTLAGIGALGTKPMGGISGVTVLYFYNANTPPPGWTLFQPDPDVRNLIVGNPANGGSFGGTGNPISEAYPVTTSLTSTAVTSSGATAGYSLTIADMPAHNHGQAGDHVHRLNRLVSGGASPFYGFSHTSGPSNTIVTEYAGTDIMQQKGEHTHATQGGNSAHSHAITSISGNVTNGSAFGTTQITPRYYSGILGRLA